MHHLIIPSRGRPEFDAAFPNIPVLMEFVRSRAGVIQAAQPGHVIQINYEPDKGGEAVTSLQYVTGCPSVEWAACVGAMVTSLRSVLAESVNVAVYNILRAPRLTKYWSVNDGLKPLFEHLDLVTSAVYCRDASHDPAEVISNVITESMRVVERPWALQLWSVLRKRQAEPVTERQAAAIARELRALDVVTMIAYVEAETEQQAKAEAEGWRRICAALKAEGIR
ncbi:hypothetical protein FBT69_11925 [Synechococcales cyanobacterium CNB]|nr:hypothetical protein [Synechococcales cyanobacterium CNB]